MKYVLNIDFIKPITNGFFS